MDDKKHNGWTNYATWRVNLEIFDGTSFVSEDFFSLVDKDPKKWEALDIVDQVQSIAEETVTEQNTREGLAVDYAMAFLSEVNYYEIAEHIIESLKEAAI